MFNATAPIAQNRTPGWMLHPQRNLLQATSTMNSMYPDLPDLTPPPKKSYNDAFAAIGPAGASPGGAGFGFPRLVGR